MPITLTQPSIGSTDWGDDVNDNWQELLDAFNSGTVTIGPVNFANAAGNYLRLPQLTTAQRNALTAVNGMMIYNSDADQFERYEDGSWGAFGAGSVTDVTASAPLASSGGTTPNISFTGTLAVANGGTGAGTEGGARTNLGLAIGTDVQAYDADLAAIAGLSSNGIISRTGAGTAAVRSITGAATDGITVTNGDGVSGNPAIALNINGLTAESSASDSDSIAIYDASASALRKMTRANFLSGISGGTSFPVRPFSEIPVTAGKVFANVHVGAGANDSKQEEGLGVMASVDGNAIWALRFQLPQALPSGTGKLRLIALAAATSGSAKVNPKWASVAMGEDPSSATLQAEGTQDLTWSAGQSDDYKEAKVTLDADTLVAGEIVVMALVFETTNWSLAVTSTWQASIIWE